MATTKRPVQCLGLAFESDEARRAHFTELLRHHPDDVGALVQLGLGGPVVRAAGEQEVAAEGGVEDVRLLRRPRDAAAHARRGELSLGRAVERDAPRRGREVAQQRREQRRLAGPRGADDGEPPTPGGDRGEVREDG